MNKLMPKFSIGAEVMSRKLGVTAIARIVGLVEGRIWHNMNMEVPGATSAFDRAYPEWTSRMVYYVEFSSPVKPLSLEQFEEEQENGNPFCEGSYDDLCQGRIFIYPEEDLQIFDFDFS